MRRLGLLLSAGLLLLAGCGSDAPTQQPTPTRPPTVEERIAAADGNPGDGTRYRYLLDTAAENCSGTRQDAATYSERSREILDGRGIDASLAEILEQVGDVTYARQAGLTCQELFSAVVTIMIEAEA